MPSTELHHENCCTSPLKAKKKLSISTHWGAVPNSISRWQRLLSSPWCLWPGACNLNPLAPGTSRDSQAWNRYWFPYLSQHNVMRDYATLMSQAAGDFRFVLKQVRQKLLVHGQEGTFEPRVHDWKQMWTIRWNVISEWEERGTDAQFRNWNKLVTGHVLLWSCGFCSCFAQLIK